MRVPTIAAILLTACASSGSDTPQDARPAHDGGGDGRPDAGPDAAVESACPDGQVATSVTGGGELGCATVDDATAEAVRARCSVYLGWRDSCNGCSDPPAKWARGGSLDCSPGAGAGNACVSTLLDDPLAPVPLAAVDLDGNVNGDDKLYTSLHCVAAPRDPRPAPCAPGWAISGRAGDTWTCTPVSEAAVAHVGGKCAVHLGWRDSCDGCTTPPAKWGLAGDGGCLDGAGADATCTTATLDGEQVNLFGLSLDGDVDGNDKLYVGVACGEPDPGETVDAQCPAGQFVIATHADGTFTCDAPAAAFSAYVRDRCGLYLGWHDSCEACTQPPTKWGRVSTASCANGVGADGTCADATLGAVTLPMFGLSTDGDVNGDDTLYLGFRCTP